MIEKSKNERRVYNLYSRAKKKLYKQEMKFGMYMGLSLHSLKEVYQSEFYKFTQKDENVSL